MKIRSVRGNNRRRTIEVKTASRTLFFPYVRLDPRPTPKDPIVRLFVDEEIGREGFTYVLASGDEGTVHVDDVLHYNQDPKALRESLLYKLTVEAQKRLKQSGISKREIVRRIGTSATQLYRLLDQTNYRKSADQMLVLLRALDCDVDVVVHAKIA